MRSPNTFIQSLFVPISNATVPEIPLMTLLKNATESEEFYQYEGSLTTPTCDEVVTFNIIKEPQRITYE